MKQVSLLAVIALITLSVISCNTAKPAGNTGGSTTKPNAATLKELDHFPKAKDSQERFVIFPEPKGSLEAKAGYQVQLIPGKTMQVDCNQHFLSGSLTEKTVEGFGYTYYEFVSNGQVGSTLMGCPDNKMTEKYVSGETKMLRYNSRLPIVVYVPKGFELKYKIWEAMELQAAPKQ